MEQVQKPVIPSYQVNIKTFGAISDGITSNTKVFEAAIDTVFKKGGGTVVIPEGLWLTGPIKLKNNINLHAEKRSEEHTSELQSRQDLHSFPTRRSSDLRYGF